MLRVASVHPFATAFLHRIHCALGMIQSLAAVPGEPQEMDFQGWLWPSEEQQVHRHAVAAVLA